MAIFYKKKPPRTANGALIKKYPNTINPPHHNKFKSVYGKLTKNQQKNILQSIIYGYMIKDAFFNYKLTMYKIMKKFNYENINQISNIINVAESVKYCPNQNGILRSNSDAVHEIF